MIDRFAAGYDAIMVDARGHGRSDVPAGVDHPVTQAEDLRGLIATLGLERPAVVGHSMGALAALLLAGAYLRRCAPWCSKIRRPGGMGRPHRRRAATLSAGA